MHAGEQQSGDVKPADVQSAPPPEAGRQDRPARLATRRRWAALAWTAGAAGLFVLLLRISLTMVPSSDVANNALQAWDMLHGHLLLHGWIIGDATYYTFELPLLAFAEIFFGLHTIAVHVAMALIYLIVAACAVAIAVTDSRGASRVARAAVTVAVLAAPVLIRADIWIPLGLPDHFGTSVFLLVPCLLVDRAPSRRFTAPLLCVILCAGQIGDVTVRYVAVPAIIVVCAYRILATRKIRTGDGANLVAAAVSLPLATLVRALMRHFGAYLMVAPRTQIASPGQWPHNGALAWHSLRLLFGSAAAPHSAAGTAAIFGSACLLAAAAGLIRVLWRWPSARRAEQVLVAAIAVNIGAYVVSTLPGPNSPHDLAALLPAGAVLAARALVPARIASRFNALAASSVALAAALLPLSAIASKPPAISGGAQLVGWLQAHGLRYGLGGYWDGSASTLLSGNQVQVRTVVVKGRRVTPYLWETNTLWFAPARHYANFVIIDLTNHDLGPAAEPIFGRPAETHRIGTWEILIYRYNLLTRMERATLPPVS